MTLVRCYHDAVYIGSVQTNAETLKVILEYIAENSIEHVDQLGMVTIFSTDREQTMEIKMRWL